MKLLCHAIFLSGLVCASAAEISPEQLEFFEAKIRPIFVDHCYKCHSTAAEKIKGGLVLDSKWGWETGGDSGPALVPGNLSESLIIDGVRRSEAIIDPMPPKSKLSDAQIAALEKWVEMGAPDPRPKVEKDAGTLVEAFDLKKRFAEHWSWRPVTKPQPPAAVKNAAWPKNVIDRFILAKIEAAGLQPALPADDRTWLRRVTFDLIGLPPTPEQIRQAANRSRSQIVDELLASPHFGEKWARHWMDLVRYAETCGHEFDYEIHHAHEYRDYLIRAFNADVPYDQFVREHIAGDLLPEPRRHPAEQFNESVIGTGFWYFHDATHAPTDVLQDEADHQDNQIDVMGKAFQGLTIACTRCHDHKFDAISTADYYALAGYLHGSARTNFPLDPGRARETAATRQKQLQAEATPFLAARSGDFEPGAYFLAAASLVRAKSAESKPDPWAGEVFEDFESGDYGGWKLQGQAMGAQPATGAFPGQQAVSGFRGKGLVNSWNRDDNLTGTLTSEPFLIQRPFVNFLAGGGKHRQTRIELAINGKPVLQTSGKNNEKLEPASWDVAKWKGKTAEIRIIDRQKGGWGHINVDHIVFSDFPAGKPYRPLPDDGAIASAAKDAGLDPAKLRAWCEVLTADAKPNTPEGILTQWLSNPTAVRQPNWEGVNRAGRDFRAETRVFADFSGEALPEGWTTSGLAFQPTGKAAPKLRFDPAAPFAEPGTADSGLLGKKHVGTLRSPSFEIQPEHEILVRLNAEKVLVRVVIDNYHMATFNGLLFNGTFFKDNHSSTNTQGEFRWLRLSGNLTKYAGHRAYLEVVDAGDGFAAIDEIRFAKRNPPQQQPHPLIQALLAKSVPKTDAELAAALNAAWKTGKPGVLNWLSRHRLAAPADFHPNLAPLLAEGANLAQNLPPARFAVTMTNGTPERAQIYIRGSHQNRGAEVPNRFLEVLGGMEGDRLTLANQIASAENPLTSRVIVNRLWHHLFGRGIVPTTDDFGPQGQPASHPELLDWLAADLVENGWSLKHAIREIALSQTYAQASVANPRLDPGKIANVDPENTLLHRMPVRRLQAEAIRDAILAVSGRLDPKQFGPGIATHRTPFMTGRGARGSGPLDGAGRRTIYLSVYRNFLNPFLLSFDMPGPFGPKGRRSVSNVPAQSLALLNDPFVIEQAKLWAQNVLANPEPATPQRIAAMVEAAFSHQPGPERLQTLQAFLERQSAEHGALDERAWADLAHALFNAKEFVYLR